MLGDIDVVIFMSAVVENVEVAVGIMSVCCWKLKFHRPAENVRLFHMEAWFSRYTEKSYPGAENV